MSLLLVNGLTVPIAEDSMSESPREVGSAEPAFDGSLSRTRQSTKTDIAFATPPLSSADALAWLELLRGKGEHWSFDTSLYGSKGLGPTAGYVASNPAGTPKFGAAVLRLTATTGDIEFTAGLGSIWTMMVWRYESAVWHHYTVCSDGKKWLDGVRADATVTTWFGVAAGIPHLSNSTGAAVDYDDLVLLPFLVSTTWPPVFGIAATAFSELPKLTLSGDLIWEASTRTVLGSVSAVKPLRGVLSGVSAATHRTLSVMLEEA